MRIAFWRKPALSEERRQALEEWARLRLHMLEEDPMAAIIGAVGRLTAEGMEDEAGMELILRILPEDDPSAP